ncbi:hypothetical protein AEAC466_19050 [Asticcacaulis sp. AC466]|nr:hypothetical protein AEAC466_19050 [Asticcacaulis sp. AC466]
MKPSGLPALAVLTLALAMAACQPALAEKAVSIQKPVDFDPNASHAQDGNALFWMSQDNGARGVKKVIIPFFQIQFVVDAQANATGAGGAHAKTVVHLDGPTPAQMQAITDELYASFVADLKAAGLEVVSPEEARTYSAFNDIMAASKPSGETVKGMNSVRSLFFAPTGMNYYFLPTMLPDLAGGGSMTAIGNTQIVRKEADLMSQSGAAVAGFRAVVDFASLSASDRRGLRALARNAKTKAEFGLVIKPAATQVFLITPNAKATMIDPQNRLRLELQAPLMIDSDAILAADDNRTKGQKTGEILGNAISLMGGVGMSKTQSFDVVVDPALWQKDVTGALKGVSQAATARLKAGL